MRGRLGNHGIVGLIVGVKLGEALKVISLREKVRVNPDGHSTGPAGVLHFHDNNQYAHKVKGPQSSFLPSNRSKIMSDIIETVTFPQRLMSLLGDEAVQMCMSWLPSGMAFQIHNVEEFETNVLKEYFNSIKWSSFTRRLKSKFDVKLWGRG